MVKLSTILVAGSVAMASAFNPMQVPTVSGTTPVSARSDGACQKPDFTYIELDYSKSQILALDLVLQLTLLFCLFNLHRNRLLPVVTS